MLKARRRLKLEEVSVKTILTRTSGYLDVVSTHSLQPYRGCSYGRALCGVGCYVQYNPFITRGRPWGSFLEVRTNAAERYLRHVQRERAWAHGRNRRFSIFMSSSTDPFVPQERTYGITAGLLQAMMVQPPDELVMQTHSATVSDHVGPLRLLSENCRLRVHLSIEGDRDRLPGLPAPASSVASRMEAAARLKEAGIFTVITVAPLFPLKDPAAFFARCGEVSDALVLDHFVGGDGTTTGSRTRQTRLPPAMEHVLPGSSRPAYGQQALRWARSHYPGPVGVGPEGFAGRYVGPEDQNPG